MSRELPIKIVRRDDGIVLQPSGEVDLLRSPMLRSALDEVIAEAPPRLVLDLSLTVYMDSSGVATLVEALQRCRTRQTILVLSGLQDRVRSVFEIAKLDSVFRIRPDVDSAFED